jgi:hypothetical protein
LSDPSRNFLFNHLGLNEDAKIYLRPDCAALAIPCPCRRHDWLKSWQKSIGKRISAALLPFAHLTQLDAHGDDAGRQPPGRQ